MSETSIQMERRFSFEELNYFPPLEKGHINLSKFLKASSDLLAIVDCLGKLLKPVKQDMQGNIEKIKSSFVFDEESCLLDLMLKETAGGKTIGTEATLWLNRALLFFELTFKDILDNLKEKQDINMKIIFNAAYEGSVKQYHNWAVQKLFMVICQLSPSFPQILTSLGLENSECFEEKMKLFNDSLHVIRCAIDNFFIDNKIHSL